MSGGRHGQEEEEEVRRGGKYAERQENLLINPHTNYKLVELVQVNENRQINSTRLLRETPAWMKLKHSSHCHHLVE